MARAARTGRKSRLEEDLAFAMWAVGLPAPEREYQFDPGRKWRADFAWPALRLLVEVEGGTSEGNRGRHMRADGYQRDVEKYNAASIQGWRLLRFTRRQITSGAALAEVEAAIKALEAADGQADAR